MSDDATEGSDFLEQVYNLASQDDTDSYYSRWAATYDDELTRQGYRTPSRCADALRDFVALDAPVLDIGCGTGLSGSAFAAVGFTNLTGTDVNAEMLAVADAAGIYRASWVTDLDDPFPFSVGTYAAIAAVGVIGVGAAPASVLTSSSRTTTTHSRSPSTCRCSTMHSPTALPSRSSPSAASTSKGSAVLPPCTYSVAADKKSRRDMWALSALSGDRTRVSDALGCIWWQIALTPGSCLGPALNATSRRPACPARDAVIVAARSWSTPTT
jgi:hypothetical protein